MRAEELFPDIYAVRAIEIDTAKRFELKIHQTKPDAERSPVYLDLSDESNPNPKRWRRVTRKMVEDIGRVLWTIAKERNLQFDAVAGLPYTGIPIAKTFQKAAAEDGVTVHIITLGKKGTGKDRTITDIEDNGSIEAIIDSRQAAVLILDDVITHGKSKDEGIGIFLDNGYDVTDVLVYCDREQGGTAHLYNKHSILLHSGCTLRQIVRWGSDHGKVPTNDCDIVFDYLDREKVD